ncbi:MAG: hypothetical protein ACP5IC_00895 [Minisyncoccia bacterium]
MSLEDLEKKLYKLKTDEEIEAKKSVPEKENVAAEQFEIKGEQLEKNIDQQKLSELKKQSREPKHYAKYILLFLGIVSFIALFAGIFLFASSLNKKNPEVILQMKVPSTIQMGVPFDVDMTIINKSAVVLKSSLLKLELPNGVIFYNDPTATFSADYNIDTIDSGAVIQKTFRLLATSNADAKINFHSSLSYTSLHDFEVDASGSSVLNVSPISIDIKSPDKVLANSNFDININIQNQSNVSFDNLSVFIKLPKNITILQSNPKSLAGNSGYWQIGPLAGSESKNINITAFLQGQAQTFFSFPVTINEIILGKEYPIANNSINIAIAPSPLELNVSVNGSNSYVAKIGDRLNYVINYRNNSGISLSNIIITAKLTGYLFDFSSLRTDGSIDTVNNTITWSGYQRQNLKLFPSNSSDSVSFSINLVKTFPIYKISDKNFLLKVDVSIISPTVPYYIKSNQTSAQVSLNTPVVGALVLTPTLYHRDPNSGFVNKGSLPPTVNQPTDYTVHLIVDSYAADFSKVVVSANLFPGVKWLNNFKSNVSSTVVYDPYAQKLQWSIDKIYANRGILTDPVELIFQIEAIPNVTQVYRPQPLVSPININAHDDFSGLDISSVASSLDTTSLGDANLNRSDFLVTP